MFCGKKKSTFNKRKMEKKVPSPVTNTKPFPPRLCVKDVTIY